MEIDYRTRVFWKSRSYGEVTIIKRLTLGLFLDAVIPCTFGGITFLLTRTKEDIRLPFSIKEKLTSCYSRVLSIL